MKCIKCGSIIPDDSVECEFCGTTYQVEEETYTKEVDNSDCHEELKEVERQKAITKNAAKDDKVEIFKAAEQVQPVKKSKSIKGAVCCGAIIGIILGVAAYYKGDEATGIDLKKYLPEWAASRQTDTANALNEDDTINEIVNGITEAPVKDISEDSVQQIVYKNGSQVITPSNSENAVEYEPEIFVDQEKQIHRYEMIVEDCTWSEAYQKCREKGGYLVRIGTLEELQAIIAQLNSNEAYSKIQFYVGGRRDMDVVDYYWVDENNSLIGEILNSSTCWLRDYWMLGEPSFLDGDANEHCMNLIFYDNEWVFNDVPDSVLSVMPSYSGKIGYICEYEE